MKENVSSRDYATSWYGENWQQEAFVHLNDGVIAQNPVEFLQNLSEQLDNTSQNLIRSICLTGETMISAIQNEIAQLLDKNKEQIASLFLREQFGPPGDPLVSAVFAELAQREVLARKDSRESAIEVNQLTERFEQLILRQIQLLIANELNKIEEEKKEYQQAQQQYIDIQKETPEITEQMQGYQEKFAKKFKDLEKKKKFWMQVYQEVDRRLASTIVGNEKKIIFELATQSTNPTVL